MQLTLCELELYAAVPEATSAFYSVLLGSSTAVNTQALKVYPLPTGDFDLAISNHRPEQPIQLGFLVDDLKEVLSTLERHQIAHTGPFDSHLNRLAIHLTDPDGRLVRISQQQ